MKPKIINWKDKKALKVATKIINSGGVLAIMTSMLTKEIDFSTWYYKSDPTHICFFSQASMYYLAKKWGADVKFFDQGVTLFYK